MKKEYKEAIAIVKQMVADGQILQDVAEKYFPELKESENERIRKEIVRFIQMEVEDETVGNKWIAYLKKQGEHYNFRKKIQPGDHVTKNEYGELVNLSQLKRVAKKDEKQGEHEFNCDKLETFVKGWCDKYSYPDDIDKFIGFAKSVIKWYQQNEQKPVEEIVDEINRKAFPNHYGGQKPADKVEPKFRIGDIISNGKVTYRVENIVKNCVGTDCYFLVDIECEKKGMRYLQTTDHAGKHYNIGETTWICEQVDELFKKVGRKVMN